MAAVQFTDSEGFFFFSAVVRTAFEGACCRVRDCAGHLEEDDEEGTGR